jgi:hypothetical protein
MIEHIPPDIHFLDQIKSAHRRKFGRVFRCEVQDFFRPVAAYFGGSLKNGEASNVESQMLNDGFISLGAQERFEWNIPIKYSPAAKVPGSVLSPRIARSRRAAREPANFPGLLSAARPDYPFPYKYCFALTKAFITNREVATSLPTMIRQGCRRRVHS